MKKILAILSASLAVSLCCITPILAVLIGSSSLASSFSWLAPYHNYLIAFTLILLAYAWWDKLKPQTDISCECDEKSGFFSSKKFLFMVSIFSLILLSFPLWGNKIFTSVPSAKSCSTGVCDSKEEHKEEKLIPSTNEKVEKKEEVIIPTQAPIIQYLKDEKAHPTPCNQVSCAGTGRLEVDYLLTYARQDVKEISPAVLKKMIDNEEDFILLDVRDPMQKAEGEIYTDEIVYITRNDLEFDVMNAIKNKEATIIVYSRMGSRSLLAAQTLKKLGYKYTYNLSGGLNGWARASYPIDTALGVIIKIEQE